MQRPRQDSGYSNFPYARYAEKLFTQIYRDLYGDAMLDQHGGRKPTEASVTEFFYKSVNLSLEELKNIKITPFSNSRTFQIAKIPRNKSRNKSLFSQLGRHVNAASRKSLEIHEA